MYRDEIASATPREETNGAYWKIGHYLNSSLYDLDIFGISLLQQCISFVYAIYLRLTLLNIVVFLLKYVPMCIYMYKFLKNSYVTSRERLKQTQMEMEDIQLQIEIVNTKLCVRDSEFTERAELLRRNAVRMRRVRARVRDVIQADEVLRRALEKAADSDLDLDMHVHNTPQDDEFIAELLKGMKCDTAAMAERAPDQMDCGEHAQSDSTPDSLYSSLSDMDVRQDCRVQIVKVTNVYKVAYLKHYIKQKRLRRANKRAILKMKIEKIKNLLEDWQKTLNMVINSKVTIFNVEPHPIDVASQDAMGDYSKPRGSSDSDSDIRSNDIYFDEYSLLSWAQNPNRPNAYNYEDAAETAVSREYYDQDNGDNIQANECKGLMASKMMSILEETGSQIAIEEIASEADDPDCRDMVAI